jgi:hypothetical protein
VLELCHKQMYSARSIGLFRTWEAMQLADRTLEGFRRTVRRADQSSSGSAARCRESGKLTFEVAAADAEGEAAQEGKVRLATITASGRGS